MAWLRIPKCGANETLNASVHGALAVGSLAVAALLFGVALLETACGVYHTKATKEHLDRLRR